MKAKKQDRMAARFALLDNERRAGLVTFITAGDPDPETSGAILDALVEFEEEED